MRLNPFLIAVFILPFQYGFGQYSYIFDQSPEATDGVKLAAPWAGGLNSAQYGTIDFDLDGLPDLVVFDRTSNKLNAYRNTGDRYEYAPGYELLFPRDIRGWILFLDYDCDGKKDIFTHTLFGIKVYRNISSSNELAWELIADPIYSEGTAGNVNLQVNISDIPGVADLDGDGDLDILVYNFATGGTIRHHKNMSVERTGQCGLDFVREAMDWGKFEECSCDVFAFDGATCAEVEGRIKHAGGKSMTLIDADGDGDKELIMSQEDCDKLYFLENKGTPDDALMNGFDMLFPDPQTPAHMALFPAAFYEDVTFDGIPDLLVSPNLSADPLNAVNFSESSWLYRNEGTANAPQFSFSKKNFLQEQMIDAGWQAVPVFADIDGDGDLDLLLAGNGAGEDGKYYGAIRLYENVGAAGNPAFKKTGGDYLQLSGRKWFDLVPAFADLNRDGAPDLAIAARSGSPSRTAVYYMINQNRTGPYKFDPETMQELDIPYGADDNLCFHDVDGDGFVDVLLGKPSGRIEYYRGGSGGFSLASSAFAGIGDNFLRRSPSPAIADVDGDNENELVLIDDSGVVRVVENFRSDNPQTYAATLPHPLGGEPDSTRFGTGNRLAAARLYANEPPVLAIGSVQGGVYLLRNAMGETPQGQISISVWPNPSESSQPAFAQVSADATLEVFTLLGQKVWTERVLKDRVYAIGARLSPGLYIVRASAPGARAQAVRLAVH